MTAILDKPKNSLLFMDECGVIYGDFETILCIADLACEAYTIMCSPELGELHWIAPKVYLSQVFDTIEGLNNGKSKH